MEENASLVLEDVSKAFGSHRAVAGVSLRIQRGEAFSLLGPSGCGKTTLLRLIAGFESPDTGRVLLGETDITALPPENRPVNTVFQNYALFPHLSVAQNIAFGLEMARVAKNEISARVAEMLEMTQLGDHAKKSPAQLSGGQKQRVAIARALINKPQVLLLDEPLAALDLKLRQHMLGELRSIHERAGTTFIYVTHDQGEAMSLSDRVAVMNAGRVEQVDTPRGLYDAPRSGFVASFVGDANFFPATVIEARHEGYVRVHIDALGNPLVQAAGALTAQQNVRVMIRPEKLQLSRHMPAASARVNAFTATLEESAYFGPHLRHTLRAGEHRILVQHSNTRHHGSESDFQRGDRVHVTFHPEEARVLGD